MSGWPERRTATRVPEHYTRNVTEAESKFIHVNAGTLRYTDRLVDPSGGEVPPGSDVVKRSKDFFISPEGMI